MQRYPWNRVPSRCAPLNPPLRNSARVTMGGCWEANDAGFLKGSRRDQHAGVAARRAPPQHVEDVSVDVDAVPDNTVFTRGESGGDRRQRGCGGGRRDRGDGATGHRRQASARCARRAWSWSHPRPSMTNSTTCDAACTSSGSQETGSDDRFEQRRDHVADARPGIVRQNRLIAHALVLPRPAGRCVHRGGCHTGGLARAVPASRHASPRITNPQDGFVSSRTAWRAQTERWSSRATSSAPRMHRCEGFDPR